VRLARLPANSLLRQLLALAAVGYATGERRGAGVTGKPP
jgi:hypothetical protein